MILVANWRGHEIVSKFCGHIDDILGNGNQMPSGEKSQKLTDNH